MQIILVSRHLKAARTIHIMPRHVVIGIALLVSLVIGLSALFSWISVRFHLPMAEKLAQSVYRQETRRAEDYLRNNLQLMATRLGEMQARIMQLDLVGERVSEMAGVKDGDKAPRRERNDGKGGPYLPVRLSQDELQTQIDSLADAVERRIDRFAVLESRMLEQRVRDRMLPTTLPVRNATLGSAFGHRADPFTESQSMHEGLDFNAPIGTPVVAAADGVVRSADIHPQYGRLVEIDHGDGLTSHYAHLNSMEVVAGKVIRRGQQIGTLGNSGRSTGPHLHFEVRMLGAPQNPLPFLKRGSEFAQIRRN